MQNACNDIVRKNQSKVIQLKRKTFGSNKLIQRKEKKYTAQTHIHGRMDGRTKEELNNSVKCGANHRLLNTSFKYYIFEIDVCLTSRKTRDHYIQF